MSTFITESLPKYSYQEYVDAAINARIPICLGKAPLLNPCGDFKGGMIFLDKDGLVWYSPPNDKYKEG